MPRRVTPSVRRQTPSGIIGVRSLPRQDLSGPTASTDTLAPDLARPGGAAMSSMRKETNMRKLVTALSLPALAIISQPVVAHPHTAANSANNQQLANGQNHPRFRYIGDGKVESCVSYGLLPNFGQAWYGLETAHHGPDQGTRGKADQCFVTEGVQTNSAGAGFPTSDRNPGIN